MQVAFSKTIKGVGILAGGPYLCAQGLVNIAVSSCMKTPSLINLDGIMITAHGLATSGYIDYL